MSQPLDYYDLIYRGNFGGEDNNTATERGVEGNRPGDTSTGHDNMAELFLATENPRLNHYPAPKSLHFKHKNIDFVQARKHCAKAVEAFNTKSTKATDVERANLWLDIVDPTRVRAAVPDAATPHEAAALMPLVKPGVFIEYGLRVRIDPTAFLNTGCVIADTPVADVTIGPKASLAPRVSIFSVDHSPATNRDGDRSIFGKPVTIGARAWIGCGAILMPGITIGADCIIGAGSVVTHSIPAGKLARGVPARVIRSIDPEIEGPPDSMDRAETLAEALQRGVEDAAGLDQARREAERLAALFAADPRAAESTGEARRR